MQSILRFQSDITLSGSKGIISVAKSDTPSIIKFDFIIIDFFYCVKCFFTI